MTEWEQQVIEDQALEIESLRASLRQAETVMMVVEPRGHKAEYLTALTSIRAALEQNGYREEQVADWLRNRGYMVTLATSGAEVMTKDQAREIAFRIVIAHPDCLQDDTVLDELIEDIAAAIVDAALEKPAREALEPCKECYGLEYCLRCGKRIDRAALEQKP